LKKNRLLNQLSQEDFDRLEPYLKLTTFKQRTLLFEAEREIEKVYFPTSGVVSLVVTLETVIEAAMAGATASGLRQRLTDALFSWSAISRWQHRWIEVGCIPKSQTVVPAHSS